MARYSMIDIQQYAIVRDALEYIFYSSHPILVSCIVSQIYYIYRYIVTELNSI